MVWVPHGSWADCGRNWARGGREGFLSPAIRRAGWYGHVWPSSPGWRHQGFPRALRMLNLEFLGKARVLGVGRTGPCLWGSSVSSWKILYLFQLRSPVTGCSHPLNVVVYWSEWDKERGRNIANPNHSRGSPSEENAVGAAGRGADS